MVKGEEKRYMTLRVHTSDLIIKLPIDNVELVGVRDVIDAAGVGEVFAVLQNDFVEEPGNWSRRYKSNQEKMTSGDVYKVAEVVRDLWRRDQDRGLSAGEKRMLGKARQVLVGELALADTVDEKKADEFMVKVEAVIEADPETTPEQAAEYVDMLERQSRKLQKLTDDLLEASKASSGAIDVQKEPTDVRELLTQSVGEFSERLEQKGIVPVLTLPEGPCVLNTDGQLLWRILDNLLSNVCKYAQADTRAYIDLETSPEETVISLKNTSASPLNISAEALMERFVRGDSSRSTEGSGLGLSIAQSLARLLGGELDLQIDGDLFKAVLRFAAVEAEE
jgi:RNA polymerase-interacting CarD/CdnL/TRCF family regulator